MLDKRYSSNDTLRRVTIAVEDWVLAGETYTLTILQAEHELGKSVEVSRIVNAAGESIHLKHSSNAAGDVTLTIPSSPDVRFAGKVTIQSVIDLS